MPRLRTYKALPTKHVLPDKLNGAFANFIFDPPIGTVDQDYRSIRCAICDEVVRKSIHKSVPGRTYTVEEQKHLDTHRHKTALVLFKLSGEKVEE